MSTGQSIVMPHHKLGLPQDRKPGEDLFGRLGVGKKGCFSLEHLIQEYHTTCLNSVFSVVRLKKDRFYHTSAMPIEVRSRTA